MKQLITLSAEKSFFSSLSVLAMKKKTYRKDPRSSWQRALMMKSSKYVNRYRSKLKKLIRRAPVYAPRHCATM